MASASTLQMMKSIPKFDGPDYVEWSRLFDDILQIFWHFLSKIVSELKKTESILRRREEDPNEGRDNDTVILMNVRPPMLMTLRFKIQQMNTCLVL